MPHLLQSHKTITTLQGIVSTPRFVMPNKQFLPKRTSSSSPPCPASQARTLSSWLPTSPCLGPWTGWWCSHASGTTSCWCWRSRSECLPISFSSPLSSLSEPKNRPTSSCTSTLISLFYLLVWLLVCSTLWENKAGRSRFSFKRNVFSIANNQCFLKFCCKLADFTF